MICNAGFHRRCDPQRLMGSAEIAGQNSCRRSTPSTVISAGEGVPLVSAGGDREVIREAAARLLAILGGNLNPSPAASEEERTVRGNLARVRRRFELGGDPG